MRGGIAHHLSGYTVVRGTVLLGKQCCWGILVRIFSYEKSSPTKGLLLKGLLFKRKKLKIIVEVDFIFYNFYVNPPITSVRNCSLLWTTKFGSWSTCLNAPENSYNSKFNSVFRQHHFATISPITSVVNPPIHFIPRFLGQKLLPQLFYPNYFQVSPT